MARKNASPPKQRDEGKTRFELRFDDDVYDAVKRAADETGISVNQLMQGIARWAMKHVHPSEEVQYVTQDVIHCTAQPGCVWFGQETTDVVEVQVGPDPEMTEQGIIPARLYFTLDFTERSVVREPDPKPIVRGGGK